MIYFYYILAYNQKYQLNIHFLKDFMGGWTFDPGPEIDDFEGKTLFFGFSFGIYFIKTSCFGLIYNLGWCSWAKIFF